MEVEVATAGGAIVGRRTSAVVVFKGIPYAEPPVRKLRWAPPVRGRSCTPTLSAFRLGSVAPQAPRIDSPIPVMNVGGRRSENCLSLNVWTPSTDPQARLPVFFWIHGGGYVIGAGSQPLYDGAAVAENGPCVVVTINYRLGPLGFLRLADLTGGAIPSTGNEGLLDQLSALEWVQENITAFGGDPENVTIAGESAGAFSVCSLLAVPRASGLFRRAIAQSGGAHTAVTPEAANAVAGAIAHRLGIDATDADSWRRVPAENLVRAASALTSTPCRRENGIGVMPFQPVVDGDLLTARPIDLIRRGASSTIPVLVGFNRHEWRLFIEPKMYGLDDMGLRAESSKQVGQGSEIVLEHYGSSSGGNDASPIERLSAIETDRIFGVPAVELAQAQQCSFLYRFDWSAPIFDGALGACHTADLGLVFGTHARRGSRDFYGSGPSAEAMSRSMMAAWMAFCREGEPGAIGGTPWPEFRRNGRAMIIDRECRLGSARDLPPVDLWEGTAPDVLGRP